MKERVEQLVGEEAQVIWMSTFHSMCVRILRRDADRIGIKSLVLLLLLIVQHVLSFL
jgi:superfamily I DNA/RNA helicase